jgi:short-subunit dehydrogenase
MNILITGTSRGLGKFLHQQLSSEGHNVIGSSRRAQGANEVALDVTDAASVARAVAEVVERHGSIDVLINNAGYHLLGAAVDTSTQELHAQMHTNFYGAVHMMRAVLPGMLQQQRGRIINVSSVGGVLATPFASAYNASKFALEGYSASLRHEVAPYGVWVSSLTPGFINTHTHDNSVVLVEGTRSSFSRYVPRVQQHMNQGGKGGVSMERVAAVVSRALRAKRPKLSYSVDGLSPCLLALRALMPSSWFERILVSQTAPGFTPQLAE